MVVVPAVRAVTKPVVWFTVATAALLLVHFPPPMLLLKVEVEPAQIFVFPLIGALGVI